MRILAHVLVLLGAVAVIVLIGIAASLIRVVRGRLSALLGRSPRQGSAGADTGSGMSDTAGGMTVEQARRILDVGPDADRETIVAAHRRIVQRLHPDRGGSSYLTAQLNEAKEVLLGERSA